MSRLVASWFGTGLILRRVRGIDAGSGTVGSVFAAAVAILVGQGFGWLGQLVATLVMVAASLWSAGRFTESDGDAGWIVIDEAAGMFLALIGLTAWPAALASFVVYRAADIFKTYFPGVAASERFPGALGVTADDLVAGLYGLAAGHVVQTLL